MLDLQWPWILLCLPLPWLVYRFAPAARQQEAALQVPFFARLPGANADKGHVRPRHWWRLLLLALSWSCLLLAAARPTWVGEPVSLPASGRDLLLAVDISGSMETRDMLWDSSYYPRIDAVKVVVNDFVKRRESDRLGLILFGTRAYVQAPLTFDRNTVQQLLSEAQLGFAGEKTAIGDAIGMAVKQLRERPQESRVLILLTDGANTAGQVQPMQAADIAAKAGVKIYTIGIGADEMLTSGFFGFGQRRVNPSADLDEATLQSIAEQTGGTYFRARSPQDLQQIYLQLDQLEPVEQAAETFRPTQSLFHWPLAAALFSLALLLLPRLLSPLTRSRLTEAGNG